jgi:phosphoglycerate dehydrogenase-like enzyme
MKILVADLFQSSDLARLRRDTGAEVVHSQTHQPTPSELRGVGGLLIRSRTNISQDLLRSAPELKVVVSSTSGFDHIDLLAVRERGIDCFFTPTANTQSAAELTLGLLLDSLRSLTANHAHIAGGGWKSDLSPGREMSSLTIGLLGCGRIGSAFGRMCIALGAQVVAYDPYVPGEMLQGMGINPQGLIEVLKHADVLSLHVPLTRETKNYINASTLAEMNHGSLLINTSRGRVIDENALVAALETGRIAGAALDVFAFEPLAMDSRLRGRRNVILSPHVAAYTNEALARASQIAVQKLVDYLDGKKVADALPPDAPWSRHL